MPLASIATARASSLADEPNWLVHVSAAHVRSDTSVPGAVSTVVVEHAVHAVQETWFVDEVNVPDVHAIHVRSLVVLPDEKTRSPAKQVSQGVQLAAFVVVVKLATHVVHTRFCVEEGTVLTYDPALQFDHGVQAAAFVVVLYVLAPQGAQTRSALALPAAPTYCPALQFVHAAHVAAFDAVLYVPAPQGVHVRLLVLVPFVPTYWPATQSVHDAQLAALVAVL